MHGETVKHLYLPNPKLMVVVPFTWPSRAYPC